MSAKNWSTAMNPLVHVYFFNPVTGIITYEAMRSPGAVPSNSPRLQYVPGQPNPRTLGKDTRGLIEDLVIRHHKAVFFIATPPSKWEPLTSNQRAAKIRSARVQVRKMELDALELDAALTQDDDDDDDGDDDPDDDSDLESNSSYGSDSSALSIGDCSGESFTLSTDESLYSRDSFSTDDSVSIHHTDGDPDQDQDQDQGRRDEDDQGSEDEHLDDNKNEDDEHMRNNVESVTVPGLPSPPSATTSDSLASGIDLATANSDVSPTSPPESPARPLPRYRLSIPKTSSSLRRPTYPASVEESYSVTVGEDANIPQVPSKKRKADDCEDSRTVKRLKMAPPAAISTHTGLPRCRCKPPKRRRPAAPSTPGPVVCRPAPQQQATSLKRKRDDEDEDDREAPGSSQHDTPDAGPAAKKPKVAPTPDAAARRRRRRRPKDVRPLARKMWDKLMQTKLVALKLGATFSDFGFLPAKKKARRAA